MIDNLYAKYLAVDRTQKAAVRAGTTVVQAGMGNGYGEPRPFIGYDVDIMLGTIHEDAARAEELVDAFMSELPFLSIHRNDGHIYLFGADHAGVRFRVTCGSGVCERVLTGTRTEQQPDPVALAAVPLIDVEVPVYEVRCIDPLAAMLAEEAVTA